MKKYHVIIKDTETNENILDMHTNAVFCTYDDADNEQHGTAVGLHEVNALEFAELLVHTEDAILEEYTEAPEIWSIANVIRRVNRTEEDK